MIPHPNKLEEESYFLEFLKIVIPYKWSIVFVALLTLLLGATYLYFKPSVYESYAIIKIKSETGSGGGLRGTDPLTSALAISGGRGVDQELAILKTFYTNNRAIDRLNLKTQYFKKERYRKIEIFANPPIGIEEITIFNKSIIGTHIILHPVESGFKIQIGDTIGKKVFHYGEYVKTPKFKFIVEKKSNFNIPIYFQLNGDNRSIYESIVKKNLKISKLNDKVSLIKVAYQDTSAARATTYVNALIDVYIKQSIIDKSKKNNKILDFIEGQLKITGSRLKLSETQLENYRVSNNVIEPSVQSTSLLDRLSNIEVEISENKIKERLIQNLITFVKKSKHLDSITPTLRELGDEPTIRVIEHLQDLQRKANQLSTEFTEKHPDLKSLRRDIRRNKQTIIRNIKNLKLNISNRQTNLVASKKSYEKNLKTLPSKEKQLIQLRRNYEVNSKMYSYLLEKKSENEMKNVATISDYEIIDRAYSNAIPIKPRRGIFLAIALIIGFLIGVALAYIRNLLIDKVQNIKDIEYLTKLPIYGKLPLLEETKLEVFNNPQSELTESFREIRTNLQFMRKVNQSNVILVTSNSFEEGKSITVANLCSIFQMANYKSIIVDLDLHKPNIHKYFNMEHEKGISTYLSGRDEIGDIIFSTAHKHLHIITAGPIAPNPSDLILSDRLEMLLNNLRKRYDYVFINSAPLSIGADTLYLMQHADVNLVVIREKVSKKLFVSNLEILLKQHDFNNVGIVINQNHPKK